MMTVKALVLASLAGCASAQTAEPSEWDEVIGQLCTNHTDNNRPSASTMEQDGPKKLTITVPVGNSPNAVYIKDADGTALAFQQTPTSPLSITVINMGAFTAPYKAYTHFNNYNNSNLCHTTESAALYTWSATVQDYLASEQNEDDIIRMSNLLPAEQTRSLPTATIDYGTKAATVTFSHVLGANLPYFYVKDDKDSVLLLKSYTNTTWPDTDATTDVIETETVNYDAYTLRLTVCTYECVDYPMTSMVVAEIEAGASTTPGSEAINYDLASQQAMYVGPAVQSAACSGGDYFLYAMDGTDVIAFAQKQAVQVSLQGVSASIDVKLYCVITGAITTSTVNITALQETYIQPPGGVSPGGNSGAPTCQHEGITHNFDDVWNAANGARCGCYGVDATGQGEVQCGAAPPARLTKAKKLSGGEIAAIILASVIFGVIGFYIVYFHYMKKQAVMEGRRKSCGPGGKYISSSATQPPPAVTGSNENVA